MVEVVALAGVVFAKEPVHPKAAVDHSRQWVGSAAEGHLVVLEQHLHWRHLRLHCVVAAIEP